MLSRSALCCCCAALSLSLCSAAAQASATRNGDDEPNPPIWPASVSVFGPGTPAANITATVNAIYNENGGRKDNGQFSSDRYALLFLPGRYDVDVPVGYYTQVLGLGESPTDVVFTGDRGVYSEEGDYDIDIGALDSFWRGTRAQPRRIAACHAAAAGWPIDCMAPNAARRCCSAGNTQAPKTSRRTASTSGRTPRACSGRSLKRLRCAGWSSRTT